MELVCRALWTYEEVTELHSEEGYGPMLAEAPMRALPAVLEPTPGAGAAVAPAREKPKGKDKGKGKAKDKEKTKGKSKSQDLNSEEAKDMSTWLGQGLKLSER